MKCKCFKLYENILHIAVQYGMLIENETKFGRKVFKDMVKEQREKLDKIVVSEDAKQCSCSKHS